MNLLARRSRMTNGPQGIGNEVAKLLLDCGRRGPVVGGSRRHSRKT
jgi:hypothetical protein